MKVESRSHRLTRPASIVGATFDRQLHDRLAALSEVESVTATQALPLSQQMPLGPYAAQAASIDLQHLRQAYVQTVLPGYFETMRTRIVEGRAFTPATTPTVRPWSLSIDCSPRRRGPANPR